MNIWSARENSVTWLSNELKSESKVLQEGFDHLSNIVTNFENIGISQGESKEGQFCSICSITIAKFNYLSLGCFSLALDGLAQEAGALLRPLIETYELLIYLRQDKSRINEVLENKLPSAGSIAKKISGENKGLREFLNKSASHFSYEIDSVRHLFSKNAKIRPVPNHTLLVLRANLRVINAYQIFMACEAVTCLFEIGFDVSSLASEIEKWRLNSIKAFS